MKLSLYDFLILISIGFTLLLADRFLRIEGFINPAGCGVYKQKPLCQDNLRCINGFCGSDIPPALKATDLPVFP